MITMHQQIEWLEQQLRHMKRHLPNVVVEGRISEEHATHKLACAQAALVTLTQLRGIFRGEGPTE
jgi:hypothetical protein